jgi:hypothetical protein
MMAWPGDMVRSKPLLYQKGPDRPAQASGAHLTILGGRFYDDISIGNPFGAASEARHEAQMASTTSVLFGAQLI